VSLEGEVALLRTQLAEALSAANQSVLTATLLAKRLGRIEERIEAAAAADYSDRHEGNMLTGPTSDGPPIIPDRLS
jgi:hypothetical protein